MGDWSRVEDGEAFEAACKLARGCYQRAILEGDEALSGSTLVGKAKGFGDRYKRSSAALLGRLTAAGIPWHEEVGAHGKRILVIGAAAAEAVAA